jgi:hypothetical protein
MEVLGRFSGISDKYVESKFKDFLPTNALFIKT